MKLSGLLIVMMLACHGFAAGPARYSFSPKFAAPGGTITVSGVFFSAPAVGFSIWIEALTKLGRAPAASAASNGGRS